MGSRFFCSLIVLCFSLPRLEARPGHSFAPLPGPFDLAQVTPPENPAGEPEIEAEGTPGPDAEPGPAADAQAEDEPGPESSDLPGWIDGFSLGGHVRFRPEFHQNYNFDRTDRVLFTSFTSICSRKRSTGRTCVQSGGVEYPDFGKANHSTVPLYVAEEDSKEAVLQKVQLDFHKEFGADVVANIVLQDSRVWGGQPGSVNGVNTANGATSEATDLREANLEIFDFLGPLTLQAGRQVLAYGDQRLVGSFEWSNVGRSFDGLRLRYDGEEFNSHLWTMILAEDPDDFNATADGNESRPTIDDAYFSGWYNTWTLSRYFQAEAYYLGVYKKWTPRTEPLVVFVDDRPEIITDEYGIGIASQSRATQRDNLHTGGLRLTNRTEDGRATIPFDWTVEAARQGGFTGAQKTPDGLDIALSDAEYKVRDVNGNQVYELKADPQGGFYVSEYRLHQLITRKVKYDAYAYAVNLGFSPIKQVRLGLEYTEGSGDSDPTDFRDTTFVNLYPTNHNHYGSGDLASWRNMRGRSANLQLDFGSGGLVRMEAWDIDKHSTQDAWYVASGARNTVATTEFATDYAPPAGQSESKEKQYFKRKLKRVLWQKWYLRKHLFEEFDLLYKKKYKGIEWNMGYTVIVAGDAARVARDDYGYALAQKYLDELLYLEQVHWTSAKIFESGDYRKDARPPTFDPRANFAYVQMTLRF